MRDHEIIPLLFLTVWMPGILPAIYVVRRTEPKDNRDPLNALVAIFWPIALLVIIGTGVQKGLGMIFDALDKVPARSLTGIATALSIFGMLLFKGAHAHGETPRVDQAARWDAAVVSPKHRMALDVELALYKRTQTRYEVIQNMRPHGVPAPILFCLHYREADNDFHCSLAQGDSLLHRSVNVPRGRIPDKEPPYSWEAAAEDSVYVVEKPPLDQIDWKDGQASLDKIESYNGWGPERHGVASGYLWSGCPNIYQRGKYVSDGRWDPKFVDKQLGVCALLKYFEAHGIKLSFVE